MKVQQILKMKSDETVVTIGPKATVSEAVTLLAERRIGAVVVSADGRRPAGILSERDIVRELGRRGTGCLHERVDALMTAALECCEVSDTARSAIERMTAGRFRHMPVVDEAGDMVGLISIGDVVAARLSELKAERDALKDMVMGY